MADAESHGSPNDDVLARIDYALIESDSAMPRLSREDIAGDARRGLEEIRDFVITDPFIRLLDELYRLPPEDRDEFVRRVLLDEDELRKREVKSPDGIKIQRSHFGDDRPTIFCVTKLMPDGVRKVTYTFDHETLTPV